MNELTKFLVESVLSEAEQGIIVLLPGGFKPPHGGHLELAKRYASQPNVSEVRILIGPKERDGITRDQSIAVWKELLIGTTSIVVESVAEDNPLLASYKYIEKAKPGTYALAASSKGDDYIRVKKFVDGHAVGAKYNRPGVNVVELPLDTQPILYKNRKDNLNGKGISASTLRADLAAKNYDNFKTNYPGQSESTTRKVFDILTKNMQEIVEGINVGDVVKKLHSRFKAFLRAISSESKETKEAFVLLAQAAQGKKKLTDEEKKEIGNQMKDVLKTMGIIAASVLPGGTIYFILIRLLRLEKYTIPNNFLNKAATTVPLMEKTILKEGGAAGHMTHPYEDYDLTFDDVEKMIDAALSGKVEFAQEKLDGQNLMVTYKDGQVRAARNKGHLKNAGETSLTVKQVKDTFANRGPIQVAFSEAMVDLEAAINKLTPEQKQDFFGNGTKFVNFEILYPETANVVPYGATQLRLHNITEYDPAGNVVNTDTDKVHQLEGAIRQVEAQNQKTYEIRVTDPVTINKSADYKKQKEELVGMLTALRTKFNLNRTDKISIYLQAWWKQYLTNTAKQYKYEIPADVMQQLINRWAFSNKDVNIKVIRDGIQNEDFKNWVMSFDGKESINQKKICVRPIEILFLRLGVYVLKNISQLVAINPNDSVRQIKADLDDAISRIKASAASPEMKDDGAALAFLKRELTRLKDIGGFKAIVPLEGIVFKYNGRLYKLTGAFAPINQILGYLKF